MSTRGRRAFVTLGVAALVVGISGSPAHAVADTTPPNPPTITGPSGRVASTFADITVTAADPTDIIDCEVNTEPVICPGSWRITGLDEGPHTVTAVARDAAGNSSAMVYVYWVVDTTGPVATVIAPSSLATTATVTFNENATGISGSSIRLVTDAGAVVPTSRSCVTNTLEATSCSGSLVRKVFVTPDEGWVVGERYRVLVNPAGAATVTDSLGNVGEAVDTAFRQQTNVTEVWPNYTWRSVPHAKARGGSYVVERRPGASASWRFTGSSVTWLTVAGPAHGKAEVSIDGTLRGTVNNYRERMRFDVEHTFGQLGSGPHTIEVAALGKKGARAGNGTLVAIDGFVTAAGVEGSPALQDVRWQRVQNAGALGGAYAVAELAGETAVTDFRGTSVTLQTAEGPRFGQVALYVDGQLRTSADLYAPALAFGRTVTVSGLSDQRHTLEVRVLGARDAASLGTAVVVDGISVS